jgi:hypothetical protein
MTEPAATDSASCSARETGMERRACARYRYRTPPQIRFLVRAALLGGEAFARDISAHGIGLLVGHPLREGTVLLLEQPGKFPGTTRTRVARVVHATPLQDGEWLIGCRFSPPLSDGELALALRQDR